MTTFPNRILIGWNLARKRGLRLLGLRNNSLSSNYEPAKHLMFGRTGRILKMWDGSKWNRIALWNQTNKFGGQNDYIEIDDQGRLRLAGTATVHDDLAWPLIGSRLESPSSHIVTNNAECTIEFKTSCDLTDYLITVPQITHKWLLGSAIHPHLHWEQTSANMPNWMIQTRWQMQGAAKTTSWTSMPRTTNAFAYSGGTLNQITAFGSITPPAGYGLSDIVDIRVLRDVSNTSGLFSGADGLGVSVFAKSFDCHVEMDTLGSNDEYVK